MTLRGLAAGVAGWFGREPVLEFTDWAEFERRAGAERAETTRQHTDRSIAASIDRAREVLGYAPRYSSLDALHEALAGWWPTARPTSAARSFRRPVDRFQAGSRRLIRAGR
jgi:nucleoside-diphosphate-sugar epimerase